MANLYSGQIDTHGLYKTLTSLTSVSFTEGDKYSIQVLNQARLREGTEGKGFLVDAIAPITYTATSDALYIKTEMPCEINIAE